MASTLLLLETIIQPQPISNFSWVPETGRAEHASNLASINGSRLSSFAVPSHSNRLSVVTLSASAPSLRLSLVGRLGWWAMLARRRDDVSMMPMNPQEPSQVPR